VAAGSGETAQVGVGAQSGAGALGAGEVWAYATPVNASAEAIMRLSNVLSLLSHGDVAVLVAPHFRMIAALCLDASFGRKDVECRGFATKRRSGATIPQNENAAVA
jgi:hypothetical protein